MLDASMAIDGVADFKQRLLQVMDGSGVVLVDASEVQRVDTSVLQVLCALRKELAESGAALEWRAPSPVLTDGAHRLGLTAALGLAG
jgi:anti-anti-sigma regulatory factor